MTAPRTLADILNSADLPPDVFDAFFGVLRGTQERAVADAAENAELRARLAVARRHHARAVLMLQGAERSLG